MPVYRKTKQPIFVTNKTLMQTFDFTAEDLAANRDKFITKHQREKLYDNRRSQSILYIAGIVVFAGLGIAYLLSPIENKPLTFDQLILPGCLLFIAAITTLLGYDKWQQFSEDLHKGDVTSIEGAVSLHITSGPRGSSCSIYFEKKNWSVSSEQFLAFSNGHRYCVYYAPNSETILSIDSLDQLNAPSVA